MNLWLRLQVSPLVLTCIGQVQPLLLILVQHSLSPLPVLEDRVVDRVLHLVLLNLVLGLFFHRAYLLF